MPSTLRHASLHFPSHASLQRLYLYDVSRLSFGPCLSHSQYSSNVSGISAQTGLLPAALYLQIESESTSFSCRDHPPKQEGRRHPALAPLVISSKASSNRFHPIGVSTNGGCPKMDSLFYGKSKKKMIWGYLHFRKPAHVSHICVSRTAGLKAWRHLD